jgi:dTDP-6-deoxy-L-talose 4-dehydrogenase (NAD+)
VDPGIYLHSEKNLDCLKGTLSLAQAAAKAAVRRFIGIGTCFEYDDSVGFVSTDTPLRPRTIYGASKAAAFTAMSSFLPQHKVEFLWCRLFYLFGEGEKPSRLFPYLHQRLAAGLAVELTSGKQVRDFLDVAEAATQIVELASGTQQGPINVCSGVPITVRQFAESIADEYGQRSLLQFGARPDNLLDPPLLVGVKSIS